jgi:hypothetical protein
VLKLQRKQMRDALRQLTLAEPSTHCSTLQDY